MSLIHVDFATALMAGEPIATTIRTISDLVGIFRDEEQRLAMAPGLVVYRVQSFCPVPEGTEGGLFLGATFLEPGRVGDEYFMTKGHFHARRNRAEYYVTVAGHGALILMSEDRKTRFTPMSRGSVHYIPERTAHRVANTGNSVLSFLACWPSDAGHDYSTIAREGFGARLREIGGKPLLVPQP